MCVPRNRPSRPFIRGSETPPNRNGRAAGLIPTSDQLSLNLSSLAAAWNRFFPMSRRAHADRDLLLGMFALKRGLIDHGQLLEAFDAWHAGGDRSMAEILVERGSLEESAVALVLSQVDDRLGQQNASRGIGGVGIPILTIPFALLTRSILQPLRIAGRIWVASRMTTFRQAAQLETRTSRWRPASATRKFVRTVGLGEVFVLHPGLDRQVALKELQSYHADDPVSQSRFLRRPG